MYYPMKVCAQNKINFAPSYEIMEPHYESMGPPYESMGTKTQKVTESAKFPCNISMP